MTDTKSQDINLDNTDEDIPLAAMTVQNDKGAMETPGVRKSKTRENEKFRKKKINENIDRFLEIVPNDQKIKLSKNQILESTFDYITELQDKCQRYHTMDAESIQKEKISELLTENDRLRKENECFLEIFRTLNIQPNGLLEMNHQLKNAAKKDDKLATQGLLSPTQQASFSQSMNVLLSPPGQYGGGDASGTGPGLMSPTIVNGNLVLHQQQRGVAAEGLNSLDGACGSGPNGLPKKEPVKGELEGHQDMDKVFQALMDETDTVQTQPLLKTPDRGNNNPTTGDGAKNPVNTSSVAVTTSSQVFVNVSTHQPSVTANEGQPKLTSAATTPATMVTQSVSGPITTTAGSTATANPGQTFVPGQATTSISSGMKVTPSIQGAVVSSAQPNIVLQQPGQTLLLSLPGRSELIPVKIAPPKQQPPVILPNQGQCGNLAKQLSSTPQKRRPIKIKEQGAMQTSMRLGGTPTPQTMTVRLGAPGGNGISGGMVLNSGGMMMQQTVQQPVVINTPGGGQQTVLMQMPVQIQQPVVQPQQQQVVYIQQNGQLIPVVVNQSATQHQQQQPQHQQVVQNPVIVSGNAPIQNQQGQPAMSNPQPLTSTVSSSLPQAHTQPNTTASSHPVFSQSSQPFTAGQAPQSGNFASLPGGGDSGSQRVEGNSQMGGPHGLMPPDSAKGPMQGMQPHVGGVEHEQLNAAGIAAGNSRVEGFPQGEENTEDILAQAAEHIFTPGEGDTPLQGNHLGGGGLEGSSTQDEGSGSHSSKHKKKKKKKEKEKEKEKKEKEKRRKKEKEKEKKRKSRAAAAQNAEAPQAAATKECDGTNGKTGQEFLESFLQDSDDQRGGEDQLDTTPPESGETHLGGVVVSRPGDILQGYPSVSEVGQSLTADQPGPAVSTSVAGDLTEGSGTDILSNSMNFIGLPTLDDEEGVGTGKADGMLVGQGAGSISGPLIDDRDIDEDDDDEDPEAHVFSPPCTPETTEEQTSNQQQSSANHVPIASGSTSPEIEPSGPPEIIDKSPPPPYPVSLQKTGGAVSRPFDILSQPWVTQTVTSSSPQRQGKVTSVPPERAADTMEGAHTAASSQALYTYGNLPSHLSGTNSSFTGHTEPLQQLRVANTQSIFPTSQAPESAPQSQRKPETTESSGVKPPHFNFYSSTPSSQQTAQDLTTRDSSLRMLTENTGMSVNSSVTVSPTSTIMSKALSSASTASMQKPGTSNLQQFSSMPPRISPPMSFGMSPPLQKSARDVDPTPESSMPRMGSLPSGTSGTFSSGQMQLGQPPLVNPTPVTVHQGNFSPPLSSRVSSGAIPSVVPPPQRHVSTPMRALEKPPKSFTKANIHRTLTSFDKEQEDKWAERERLAKEARKPPPSLPDKAVTKPPPAANPELEDDSVGHIALSKDLVNKFPWLADEVASAGKKGNITGKPRNPTPFSVQSMAQSSAAHLPAAQRSQSKRGQQGRTKASPTSSTKGRGGVSKKQSPPQHQQHHQGNAGGSLNLWNPSFSKGDQKSQNTVSNSSPSDEVTIIEDDDDPPQPQPPPPPRTLKNILLNQQSLALAKGDSVEQQPKGRRKVAAQTSQQNQLRGTAQVTSTSNDNKGLNPPAGMAPSTLESVLGGPSASSIPSSLPASLPPYSTSYSQHQTSKAMNVAPFSQFTTSGLFAESQSQNTAPKASSQSPHLKAAAPPMVNPTLATASHEQDHAGDFFTNSLDFLFGKADQASELTDNMGTSLPGHQELNALPAFSKQSSMPTMRNQNYEQAVPSSSYGQPSPVNQALGRQQQSPMNQPLGRQQQSPVHHQAAGRHHMGQGLQRMTSSSPAPAPRSLSAQPVSSGVKRLAPLQQAASKRQQKEGDILRGSPALSDSSHLGSPDTGSYGSPMVPGDLPGPTERYRYQQGMMGYPGQSNMPTNVQTHYQQGGGGMQKKQNLSMEAAEVKRSKAVHGQVRNPTDEWPGQGPHGPQGSRGIPRHGERGSQNPAGFVSEMSSPTVPSSTFSQSDLAGNGGLLSSLSPTRHLRPNELPTYLPSIPVRNPILTSPPYPGKTSSAREPEINFESMFASTRPNTLPLNVPHNYTMFPDHPPHPPPHNSGLPSVKHGHVGGHMGNSSAGPFNFSNIFSDAPPPVSTTQVHPSQASTLNHGLHPAAMHLGTPQADDAALRGGVNQRHRNQQLGGAPGMRLEHLFNPNSMGVPPHPFVPGMPPF